uniref:UDP-glucuronosyltransferase n=1 Tax=Leptobrachium leishanense TaxID=445787 RepID=A0A8C5WDJ4_9ANUR
MFWNLDVGWCEIWLLGLLSHRPAFFVFLLGFLSLAEGGKLLVIPVDGSHWLSMKPVVERVTKHGNSSLYTLRTYSVPYSTQEVTAFLENFGSSHFNKPPFPGAAITMFHSMMEVFRMFRTQCTSLLFNKELMQDLKEEKYDAVLTDPFILCGVMVAEYLGVPNVNFLRGLPCTFDYISARCPSPLSYVPRMFSQSTDKMDFMQRLKNLLIRQVEFYYCSCVYEPWEKLASEFLNKEVNVLELISRSSVWLLRYDFVLEYPRPIMPNMVYIGGINCAVKKTLNKVGISHSSNILGTNLIVLFIICLDNI